MICRRLFRACLHDKLRIIHANAMHEWNQSASLFGHLAFSKKPISSSNLAKHFISRRIQICLLELLQLDQPTFDTLSGILAERFVRHHGMHRSCGGARAWRSMLAAEQSAAQRKRSSHVLNFVLRLRL